MRTLSGGVDWLTITKHYESDVEVTRAVAGFLVRCYADELGVAYDDGRGLEWVKVRSRGYKYAAEVAAGVVVSVGGSGKQGVMVTFSGVACVDERITVDIVKRFVSNGWKVTRLDYRVDVLDVPDIHIDGVRGMLMEAYPDSMPREYSSRKGKSIDVVGFGARQSERYLRIYDRYLKTKDARDQNIVRYEVELKGRLVREVLSADNALDQIKGQMAIALGQDDALVAHMCHICDLNFDFEVVRVGRKKTNTELWLSGLVRDALAKFAMKEPDVALMIVEGYLEDIADARKSLYSENEGDYEF